jgi:NAD(P)-dependent dehydrogenase (short-subunit alcohol dehydrogenase family)
MGSIADTTAPTAATYRISKAALNMACMTLAHEPALRTAGARVLVMHPGWVATDMGSSGGRVPPLTVEDSTAGMVEVIGRAVQLQGSGEMAAPEGDALAQQLLQHNCAYITYSGDMLHW